MYLMAHRLSALHGGPCPWQSCRLQLTRSSHGIRMKFKTNPHIGKWGLWTWLSVDKWISEWERISPRIPPLAQQLNYHRGLLCGWTSVNNTMNWHFAKLRLMMIYCDIDVHIIWHVSILFLSVPSVFSSKDTLNASLWDNSTLTTPLISLNATSDPPCTCIRLTPEQLTAKVRYPCGKT